MRTKSTQIAPFVILLTLFSLVFAGQAVQANQADISTNPAKYSLDVSETGIYIIQLNDASLARYQGGVLGLKATSPEATGARRLDTHTPESKAYLKYLDGKQNQLLGNMQKSFGRSIEVVYQYKNVLNAVAVRISHAEALQAFGLPGVRTVFADGYRQLDTDAGPTLIGAPAIWSGETLGEVASKGEGVIIGIIDSGINHAHPSFADVGGDLYDHENPYGDGIYTGVCASDPAFGDFCNDKLIGAYDLTNGGSTGGPEDQDGHGSHTSSTAGGNVVTVAVSNGAGGTFDVNLSGVAPHANLIAYRVCNDAGGCEFAATIAAVDLAITDQVDVLNYSISGSDDPWNDGVDLAFLDGVTAGIFISASAGNDGPDPSTVAKTGPWNAAVAASTHGRILAHPLDILATDGSLIGLGAVEGSGPLLEADFTDNILWGGDIDATNIEGCAAWPAGSFDGVIGMVQRGTCTFVEKVDFLVAAGAVGVLVYNNVSGPPTAMGGLEATTVPSMMITKEAGLEAATLISGDPTATATMYVAQSFVYDETWEDIMAGFSSRGPSQWELLKPDYTGPGVNILAAVAALGEDVVRYDYYQGTSMSSPHGAGSAALLTALHPEWSPAEIKSAIALTADQDVWDSDGVTLADPFDDGSGRIDLAKAAFAGFVMDETSANYIAANPYLGGEPNTLNQPSMVEYTCIGLCTWTRTIKSTLDVAQEWVITFDTPAGLVLSADPMSFTLPAGGEQTIEITADMYGAAVDQFYFADVILTPIGSSDISVAHLPVVAKLGASSLPGYLDIETSDQPGTETIEDIQAFYPITDLYVEVAGMVEGTYNDLSLDQDATNSDPFDDLAQVYYTTLRAPSGSLRLVAEIVASEATDIDLFIGTGRQPSEDTIVCTSASGIWAEYCNLDNPSGWYWVLVQNWEGSAEQPDAIRLVTALVEPGDEGNLSFSGPATQPSLVPFDLVLAWDEPSLAIGDHWYAQFSVGTSGALAGDLGDTNLDLAFVEEIPDFYDLELMPATVADQGSPGNVVSYTLTLTNLGNVEDTVSLSYAGNLWDVSLSETSVTLPVAGTAEITVDVTIPADAEDSDFDVVTITATSTGAVEASSELTTTAVVEAIDYFTWMPLIQK